jgi:hypothetical protein
MKTLIRTGAAVLASATLAGLAVVAITTATPAAAAPARTTGQHYGLAADASGTTATATSAASPNEEDWG